VNKISLIMLTLIAAASVGCASGSALVTGQTRAAIEDHSTVMILTEMPEDADHIAVVKASSDMGFSQQQRLDYAVEELKKQAAKVGANAVVLTDRSTEKDVFSTTNYGTGGTSVMTEDVEVVKGIAVYVGL